MKTKSTQINIRANEQTRQELDALVAASVSQTISEYIRQLIHKEYMEKIKNRYEISR